MCQIPTYLSTIMEVKNKSSFPHFCVACFSRSKCRKARHARNLLLNVFVIYRFISGRFFVAVPQKITFAPQEFVFRREGFFYLRPKKLTSAPRKGLYWPLSQEDGWHFTRKTHWGEERFLGAVFSKIFGTNVVSWRGSRPPQNNNTVI